MNKVTLLDREFHLGIGFLNKFIDGTGKDLATLGEEMQNNIVVILPKMMFYSLAYSYERSGKELDFDINTIFDLIDENGGVNGSFCADFLNAFTEAMYKDVPVDNSKKKAIAKK